MRWFGRGTTATGRATKSWDVGGRPLLLRYPMGAIGEPWARSYEAQVRDA